MAQSVNPILEHLKEGTYLDDKEDNKLLLTYLKAKQSGEYGSLQYGEDGNGCSNATLLKNAILTRQALNYLGKPFNKFNRDDAILLRDKLKKNIVKAVKWRTIPGTNKLEQYKTDMSYSTKRTILLVLNQFWAWYQEYIYIEKKQEIPNIFDRIKLKRPKETEHKIDWLKPDELKKLMKFLEKHEDFRFLVAVAIDSCARPLELANIRKKHFFYEGDKLMCKLPNIKSCSGRKNATEVLYEKKFIVSKIKDLEQNDFLFNYVNSDKPLKDSPGCFDWSEKRYSSLVSRTKNFTFKITGKRYTPYVFRKTATMHWLRISKNDVLFVQQKLGHVEGSPQIKHYLSLQGIQTPEGIGKRLKDDKYQSVSEEMQTFQEQNTSMKLQMEQMQKQMEMMQTQFLNTITQMPNISKEKDVELVRQTVDAVMSKQKYN